MFIYADIAMCWVCIDLYMYIHKHTCIYAHISTHTHACLLCVHTSNIYIYIYTFSFIHAYLNVWSDAGSLGEVC